MKLLYEDKTWKITRRGRKYPALYIEKFHNDVFKKMYEIRVPAAANLDFDWWLYSYNICTSRRMLNMPVPRIKDILALVLYRSDFKIPEVAVEELDAILLAEKMVNQ